jgi:hypothetical protein
MLIGVLRRQHQILDAIGADRLNNVRTDGLQEHGLVPPMDKKPKR